MIIKRCNNCGKLKSINKFYKNKSSKNGLHNRCKECISKYYKEYYKNNIEKHRKRKKEWYKNNLERIKENRKKWIKNNPEYFKEYSKKYYKNNLKHRLSHRVSALIWQSLKRNKKGYHWEDLLDYTLQDLIVHLESLFKDGMTWQNMGKWQIDHIQPISSFNFNSYKDKEFKQCWKLNNLQPLWEIENKSKGNRFEIC